MDNLIMFQNEVSEMRDAEVLIILKNNSKINGTLKGVESDYSMILLENCIYEDDKRKYPYKKAVLNREEIVGIFLLDEPLDLKEFKNFLEIKGLENIEFDNNFLLIEDDKSKIRIYSDKTIETLDIFKNKLKAHLDEFTGRKRSYTEF